MLVVTLYYAWLISTRSILLDTPCDFKPTCYYNCNILTLITKFPVFFSQAQENSIFLKTLRIVRLLKISIFDGVYPLNAWLVRGNIVLIIPPIPPLIKSLSFFDPSLYNELLRGSSVSLITFSLNIHQII